MYYKLPEDIRKTIYELEESYPFFKPERLGTKPRRHSLYLCGSKTRQPRCC